MLELISVATLLFIAYRIEKLHNTVIDWNVMWEKKNGIKEMLRHEEELAEMGIFTEVEEIKLPVNTKGTESKAVKKEEKESRFSWVKSFLP